MNSVRDPLGFSFELSESAPPVRSEEPSPIGDLDLDLNELGHGLSPVPERAAGSWLSSPFSPLLPAAEAPLPAAEAPLPAAEAPLPAAEPHTQAVAAAASSLSEPAPSAHEAAPRRAVPGPVDAQPASSLAPAIKKISFPRAAASSKKAAQQLDAAPPPAAPIRAATKSTSATRFSASISQRAPEAALIDRDSDPDHSLADQQAIPEDLPAPTDLDAAAPQRGGVAWSNDTPNAQEIWRKARQAWQSTSKHAVTFSGQGLKSAQKLAQNVNHKLQTRLEDSAKQRRQHLDEKSATLIRSRAHADFDFHAAPTIGTSSTMDPAPPHASTNERAAPTEPSQLRLRQGSKWAHAMFSPVARAAVKKAGAPLAALSAAALVYAAGSYAFGTDGAISLQKSSASDPQIPHLGSLPGSGNEAEKTAVSKVDKRAAAAPSSAAAPTIPEMKSEQTTMPEGLSWPGKGLIEVVTSEDELIYIDGVFTGRGPLRRIPVTPGKHHVAIKAGGQTRTGEVSVEADKNTRAVFKAKTTP